MQAIDWIVLSVTLLSIVLYGTWKTRGRNNVQDYIRGGNESKWWTIGLSVMATQASAITFLSTPGQAFHSGMGFVQFYFGVPIAMVIICMVFIPLYHRLKVYTAYEYLETRFDLKTRTLTAILFLIQRGLAAGITIFAPAIILSAVLGWNLTLLNIIIGVLVIIYTVSGGTKAVSVTQKHQMAVIFTGMFIAFFLIISYLPDGITFSKALDISPRVALCSAAYTARSTRFCFLLLQAFVSCFNACFTFLLFLDFLMLFKRLICVSFTVVLSTSSISSS